MAWLARYRGGDREAGLAALELAILTPFVIAMLLTVVGFGRYVHGKQVADQSASAAVRAAALANTPGGAGSQADAAARNILDNAGISCSSFDTTPDTSQFHPGGQVRVTVRCTASLSGLALAGLPGSVTLTSTATAPIENYRDLAGDFGVPSLKSPVHTSLWRRLCRTVAGRKARYDSERGSIALYMAILATAMIAMAGLVIDGGTALATKEKAADVAEQAARAGANALSPESLRNGSPDQLQADPVAARKAANAIMADNGATGTVTFDGNTVTVRATIAKKTSVLSVVHLNDISQTATWSATAIHGTTVAGN